MAKKKVSRDFIGICTLKELPERSYFKIVKKDGSLTKTIYWKPKNLTIAIPKNTDFIPLAMYGVPVVKKKER